MEVSLIKWSVFSSWKHTWLDISTDSLLNSILIPWTSTTCNHWCSWGQVQKKILAKSTKQTLIQLGLILDTWKVQRTLVICGNGKRMVTVLAILNIGKDPTNLQCSPRTGRSCMESQTFCLTRYQAAGVRWQLVEHWYPKLAWKKATGTFLQTRWQQPTHQ